MSTNLEKLLDQELTLEDATVDVIPIQFNSTVHLPFGTITDRPSAWLQLQADVHGSDRGITHGAAEGTALPMQIPMYDDYTDNLADNITRLIQPLKGETTTLLQATEHLSSAELGGNFATARMTVETALIDTIARAYNTSAYELLSENPQETPLAMPYGKSIAETTEEKIVSAGLAAAQKGARRLKFKLSPKNVDAIYNGVLRLHETLSEDTSLSIMVDANGSFDPRNSEHLAALQRIDSLGLTMIEEPVSRAGDLRGLDAHRELHKVAHFDTPIALDDAIINEDDARTAINEDLGSIINLKPGRVGSFVRCLNIADMAKASGRQIMVGGMYEATPGRSMTLTLAALCLERGFNIPGDISLPQERLLSDLVPSSLSLNDQGDVLFSPTLGWGYEL